MPHDAAASNQPIGAAHTSPRRGCTAHRRSLVRRDCNATAMRGRLPLFYINAWGHNFGDLVGPQVVRFVAGTPSLEVWDYSRRRRWPSELGTAETHRVLLAIGSIASHVFIRGGAATRAPPHEVLWGTGLKDPMSDRPGHTRLTPPRRYDAEWTAPAIEWKWARHMIVRATRGPITAKVLEAAGAAVGNVAYGDPALLLPWIFPRCHRACAPARRVCLIPHGLDMATPTVETAREQGIAIRNPRTASPEEMLEFLLGCALVISSSLHGLVFADAFGVPARWIRIPGTGPAETADKFFDYYLGTGRGHARFASNLSEALAMGGEDGLPHEYTGVELFRAFPHDLMMGCAGPDAMATREHSQAIGARRGCTSA